MNRENSRSISTSVYHRYQLIDWNSFWREVEHKHKIYSRIVDGNTRTYSGFVWCIQQVQSEVCCLNDAASGIDCDDQYLELHDREAVYHPQHTIKKRAYIGDARVILHWLFLHNPVEGGAASRTTNMSKCSIWNHWKASSFIWTATICSYNWRQPGSFLPAVVVLTVNLTLGKEDFESTGRELLPDNLVLSFQQRKLT